MTLWIVAGGTFKDNVWQRSASQKESQMKEEGEVREIVIVILFHRLLRYLLKCHLRDFMLCVGNFSFLSLVELCYMKMERNGQ